MKKNILLFLLFACTIISGQFNNTPQQLFNKTTNNFFIENKGQWNPEVKYLAHIRGMNAWITRSGVVYDYYRIKPDRHENRNLGIYPGDTQIPENKNTYIEGHVVAMQLVNAHGNTVYSGNSRHAGYYNYFIGDDKSKWACEVKLYDTVEIFEVYKNIDIKYYFDKGMLRYDFKAKPGADVSQIKLKFSGQEAVQINAKGELVLKTSIGEVTNGKLYAYQLESGMQREIACTFELKEEGLIGLKLPSYDLTQELIIDPLIYSTFIGGSDSDQPSSLAIDRSGNAYITGYTASPNYPTSIGAYQTALNDGHDAFVTKLNATGRTLDYSTFGVGGISIAVDKNGNAYACSYNRVMKLNAIGSAFEYSLNLQNATITSIAVDTLGYAYCTGNARQGFLTSAGAYKTTEAGIFIVKLNPIGTGVVYAAIIGGNAGDKGNSVAIDAWGNAYITGNTSSSNYPTTSGAFKTTYNGNDTYGHTFVTKLNSTGNSLVYSTFISDSLSRATSIAIDASGNAYITGSAMQGFPTTQGTFQSVFAGGAQNPYTIIGDVFVTKLNTYGSGLVYSTYIGGKSSDEGISIAVDPEENAFVFGNTWSSNFPITEDAYQTIIGDPAYGDAFVIKLNPYGNGLFYSTFIGGLGGDAAFAIAVDAGSNVYISGFTFSSNFPTTNDAYQPNYSGGQFDGFITKLNIAGTALIHDVGILRYNGANQYKGGSTYTPSAQIQNFGASSENFSISCKIYDYNGNLLTQSSRNVLNITAGMVVAINFEPYMLNNNFLYKIEFTTQLIGDLNAQNNSLSEYINTYTSMKKSVLVEIGTETACPYARATQIGCNNLINNNKNAAIIAYHPYDNYATSEGTARSVQFYGIASFPSVFFDGTLRSTGACYSDMYSIYKSLYDSMSAVKTPMDIFLVGKATSPNTYNVAVNIHKLAPFVNTNTKLFVALTESKIPCEWFELSEIDYCERQMMPPDGKGFAINLVNIDSVSIPITVTTQPSWVKANLELSAWVQDISTGEIFNTTKVKLSDFSVWQADIIIKDNGNIEETLTFGKASNATDGIDTLLGEQSLTSTQFGFDARFLVPSGEESLKDYRKSDKDSLEWVMKFKAGSGGYPITFIWDKNKLPQGNFYLTDMINGTIVHIDMTKDSTYTLTNTGISSLKIEYANVLAGVANDGSQTPPTNFSLSQNFPNPFNPSTVIKYTLPFDSKVSITVYNVLGQEVRLLKDEIISPGNYEVQFYSANLPSGVYFYRLSAESIYGKRQYSSIKKMMLLK